MPSVAKTFDFDMVLMFILALTRDSGRDIWRPTTREKMDGQINL